MKKLISGIMLSIIVLFSGCASLAQEAGNQYIKDNNLTNNVSWFCYDLIDKKPCPGDLLQTDIKVMYLEHRFCFGFTDDNTTRPPGMMCFKKDLIKGK